MKFAFTAARLLLGLTFLIFGLNGFFHFIPLPPPTGASAQQFFGAIFASGYWVVIFGLQAAAGLMLLINRYVPLTLTLLGPVVANIFFFHAFMAPEGLPPAIAAVILWFAVFASVRSAFSSIFRVS
jgi:hypothetical protein